MFSVLNAREVNIAHEHIERVRSECISPSQPVKPVTSARLVPLDADSM